MVARAPRSRFSSRMLRSRRSALAAVAAEPAAAAAQRLDEAIGGQRRLGLVDVLEPRPARVRLERPLVERLDAVVLAAAPDADDAVRRLELGEVQVVVAEAVEAAVLAVARAGAAALRTPRASGATP